MGVLRGKAVGGAARQTVGGLREALASGDMLAVATAYVDQGVSVIPVKPDGSKSPRWAGWRSYATRLPTAVELAEWFGPGAPPAGLGVPCGPASGNLVVLDFECKAGVPAYAEWLSGLPRSVAAYLSACPIVRTPSGGRHVWARLPESVAGGKLARYVAGSTKIEVRGEGHQVLAPGCPPCCHASGSTYEFEGWGWLT